MAGPISVDLMEIWRDSEPSLTLEVRGYREFSIRVWISNNLIRLACWVLGAELDEYDSAAWSALWKKAAKRERFQRRATEAMVKELSG